MTEDLTDDPGNRVKQGSREDMVIVLSTLPCLTGTGGLETDDG